MKKKFTKQFLMLILLTSQLNFKGISQGSTVFLGEKTVLTFAVPTGGNVTISGDSRIHTFNESGQFKVPNGFGARVQILIIGGGGGGGYRNGGGGGAGGLADVFEWVNSTQDVLVGNGGAGSVMLNMNNGDNGEDTQFLDYVEGGGGGGTNKHDGYYGGSGGGGSNGGYGGPGSNFNSGNHGGSQNAGSCCSAYGAGGGGAGAPGADAFGNQGSAGGDGKTMYINGGADYGGGGGGGNGVSTYSYQGGIGGGGSGGNTASLTGGDGKVNTGGGGGGGGSTSNTSGNGGNGGSGIAIAKYSIKQGLWNSDDASIVSVDANTGEATGHKIGSVNIRYTVSDGMNGSIYDQTVTVSTRPLPISLLVFKALEKNCAVQLVWHSGTEINSSYYGVEYSRDGTVFTQAAQVKTNNNVIGGDYTYTFSEIFKGNIFYRLKMVDNDGKFTYSKIVAVSANANCGNGMQLKVSPNPVKNILFVEGVKKGDLLTLINAEGKQVAAINAAGNSQRIDISMFAKGMYILHCKAVDGSLQTSKVIKQ